MPSRPGPVDLATLHSQLTAEGVAAALHGAVLHAHDDGFAWLPDGCVDLVLTDPPFNIAQETNFHTYEGNTIHSYKFDGDGDWDTHSQQEFLDLMRAWAAGFARVLRPGGSFAVFCADAYLSHLRDALEAAGLQPKRTFTWRKPNAVPVNRRYLPMSACEYLVVGVKKGKDKTFNASPSHTEASAELAAIERVLVADKAAAVVEAAVRAAIAAVPAGTGHPEQVAKAAAAAVAAAADRVEAKVEAMFADGKLRGCVPNHVANNSKGGVRLHRTEKPVDLLRYFTALYSRPGDLVLDPFAGSASTGEAALALGRRAVLVERDAAFYATGAARLRQLFASTE